MNRWVAMFLGACTLLACSPSTPPDGSGIDASDVSPPDVAEAPCDGGIRMLPPPGCVGVALESCTGQPFCPARVQNDPDRPQFVITQIDIQRPASLRPTGPVGQLLNNSIARGTFFWGMSVDLSNNVLRTGALSLGPMSQPGSGFLEETFQYISGGAPPGDGGMPLPSNRWDPVTVTITPMGESFSSETVPLITVPVYSDTPDRALLAELPLRNTRMRDVHFNHQRNCIGFAPGNRPWVSCLGGRWLTTDPATMMPTGVLEGDLTVEDARAVYIEQLRNNLCYFIAGSDCSLPMEMWRNPPDTRIAPGTGPNDAWHLVAHFAAVAARIR